MNVRTLIHIPSQFMIKNPVKNTHVLKRYCNSEPFRKFKGQPFRFFPLVLRILIKPQLPFNILVKEIQHPAFTLSYQIRRRNIYLKSISVSWIVCAIRPESLPLIVIEFFAVEGKDRYAAELNGEFNGLVRKQSVEDLVASLPDLDRNYSPQVEEENSSAVESEASSASSASSEAE